MLSSSNSATLEPPAWLRDDLIESNIPLKNDTSSSHGNVNVNNTGPSSSHSNNFLTIGISSSGQKHPIERKRWFLFWGMKIISMLLCVLMAATAVIGLGSITTIDESEKIDIGVYMFLFAVLLFVFEALGIYQIEWLDHVYRRNFGFLYSTTGKAFFIIFVAFLAFGLDSPKLLSMCTGISWTFFGGGIITLYLKYPELFDQTQQ